MPGTTSCEAKHARLFVGGEEIPVVDEGVEVVVRKDGPADKVRIADAWFPFEWRGEDVVSAITSFGGGTAQEAHVQLRRPVEDSEWHTVARGPVRGAGAGGEVGKGHLQIDDYANYLDAIPVSISFSEEQNSNITDLVDFVIARFEEEVSPSSSINRNIFVNPLSGETNTSFGSESTRGGSNEPREGSGSERQPGELPNKTFQRNRHTLGDVLRWGARQTGTFWWFDPTPTGITLNMQPNPLPAGSGGPLSSTAFADSQNVERVGGNEGIFETNEVQVWKNNAMYEIRPINHVTVFGSSASSVLGIDIPSSSASREFPVAEADHIPLQNQAAGGGSTVLSGPVVESDATTTSAAEQVAAKELVEQIQGAGNGHVVIDGEPELESHAPLTIQPTCGDQVDVSVPGMDLEVQRARHVCPATERYTVNCDVSVSVFFTDIQTTSRMEQI